MQKNISISLTHFLGAAAILWWTVTACADPTCQNATLTLTPDFSWGIGSAEYFDPIDDTGANSAFRWWLNGSNVAQGTVAEGLLLLFDNTVEGASGEVPLAASRVGYTNGFNGQALMLQTNGMLRYAVSNNWFPAEGTIEMRVALREPGSSPVYTNRWQPLFTCYTSDSDYLVIAQSHLTGVIYFGGKSGGQWQSAYSGAASMRSWQAGEWHHIACTFSSNRQSMRLYLDGMLVADTNEGRYQPFAPGATFFTIGCDWQGLVALYLIDEVRISGRVASAEELAARAARRSPPRPNEVWAPTTILQPGDEVTFEFIPMSATATGTSCQATFLFPGIPIVSVSPSNMLLAAGSTNVGLTVRTRENATCRYAVGAPLPFDAMTPFEDGAGTRYHFTRIRGINPDPNVINHVYVRCSTVPEYVLTLAYRCLPAVRPAFPRVANLWGEYRFEGTPLSEQARISLWIVDRMSPTRIRELRTLNTNLLVLTSVNAIENTGLPDHFYLKGTNGQPVEVWPGSFRLNITKPEVADYQAAYAARRILEANLAYDGCFFDNVMLSQSWLKKDIYGRPFVPDYNEDGLPDDPAELDAAWRAGVLRELRAFRTRMPHAIMMGHAMDIFDPEIAELFNGAAIGFDTADVIEGQNEFDRVYDKYHAWCTLARSPRITMVESSPIDLFAYGYGYRPLRNAPAGAIEFARLYGPWMRFGLAFTLMQDGYFAHEWGDTDHGQNWWYDELNYSLGQPLGEAYRVETTPPGPEQIVNGGFESPITWPWRLWADATKGCAATVTVARGAASGLSCAQVDIQATNGEDWTVELAQYNCSLISNAYYEVRFMARADVLRRIMVTSRKGSPDYRSYGLARTVLLTTNWQAYSLHFTATDDTNDARLQFLLGRRTGRVWLDEVSLRRVGPDVYRRDFERGTVLLNASRTPQTVSLGAGFRRLSGNQMPRYDVILDDADPAFSAEGPWQTMQIDSGLWMVSGPYYHDWGDSCRLLLPADSGTARWTWQAPEAGTYTVEVWWPNVPSNDWTEAASYTLTVDGTPVTNTIWSQRSGGDQWNAVGSLFLPSNATLVVALTPTDGLTCVADAVRIHSAARYNDRSDASVIRLNPLDGIVLVRHQPRVLVQLGVGTGGYLELDGRGYATRYTPLINGAPGMLLRSLDWPWVLMQRGDGGEVGLYHAVNRTYRVLANSVPGWIARSLDGNTVLGQAIGDGSTVLYDIETKWATPLHGPAFGWIARALDGRYVLAQHAGTGQVLLVDVQTKQVQDLGMASGWQVADYHAGVLLLQQGVGGQVGLWDTRTRQWTLVLNPYPNLTAVSLDTVWPDEE